MDKDKVQRRFQVYKNDFNRYRIKDTRENTWYKIPAVYGYVKYEVDSFLTAEIKAATLEKQHNWVRVEESYEKVTS